MAHNPLPHRHGHLSLTQDAVLGPQRLESHIGSLLRGAPGGEGARVGGGFCGGAGLPVGGVAAGGGEDVGLGDEALEGEIVRQKGGAVFGLGLVGLFLFWVGGVGLCRRCVAWWTGGLFYLVG